LADHETQTNSLTQLSHPAHIPDLAPAGFWLFEYLKLIPNGRGAARKLDGYFNVNPDIYLPSSI
jgi:hypothetical protein